MTWNTKSSRRIPAPLSLLRRRLRFTRGASLHRQDIDPVFRRTTRGSDQKGRRRVGGSLRGSLGIQRVFDLRQCMEDRSVVLIHIGVISG